MIKLRTITYKEERLSFFVDQKKAAQKRYNRLKKSITPDEPYMSENRQFLNDCGRELSFYDDIIKLLEDDMCSQTKADVVKEVVRRLKQGRSDGLIVLSVDALDKLAEEIITEIP